MEEPERSTTPGIPTIFALDENDQEAVVEVDNLDDELEDDDHIIKSYRRVQASPDHC